MKHESEKLNGKQFASKKKRKILGNDGEQGYGRPIKIGDLVIKMSRLKIGGYLVIKMSRLKIGDNG